MADEDEDAIGDALSDELSAAMEQSLFGRSIEADFKGLGPLSQYIDSRRSAAIDSFRAFPNVDPTDPRKVFALQRQVFLYVDLINWVEVNLRASFRSQEILESEGVRTMKQVEEPGVSD